MPGKHLVLAECKERVTNHSKSWEVLPNEHLNVTKQFAAGAGNVLNMPLGPAARGVSYIIPNDKSNLDKKKKYPKNTREKAMIQFPCLQSPSSSDFALLLEFAVMPLQPKND